MRHFLLYAVLRLGLWALIWWLLTLMHVGVMLAGVLAALIAMLLSILFLDRFRSAAALRWKAADERRAERRGPVHDEDADYEDSVLDAAEDPDSEDPDSEDSDSDPEIDPETDDADDESAADDDAFAPADGSTDAGAGDAEGQDPSGPAALPELGRLDEGGHDSRGELRG